MKMTLEKAEKILKNDPDSGVSNRFEAKRVAFSKKLRAYFVEWTDLSVKDAYKNGVADARDPKAAKNAYSLGGAWKRFSVIFVNDSPDGEGASYAAAFVPDEDRTKYEDVDDLEIVDAK